MKKCSHSWQEVNAEPCIEWCAACGTVRLVTFSENGGDADYTYMRPDARGPAHDYTKMKQKGYGFAEAVEMIRRLTRWEPDLMISGNEDWPTMSEETEGDYVNYFAVIRILEGVKNV